METVGRRKSVTCGDGDGDGDSDGDGGGEGVGDPALGNVGYRFRKHFPGHGYFDGIVIQIRPEAALGKDRRCVYSDGDLEDLSLNDLHVLNTNRDSDTTKTKIKTKNISEKEPAGNSSVTKAAVNAEHQNGSDVDDGTPNAGGSCSVSDADPDPG